jgi:hypothetical protein
MVISTNIMFLDIILSPEIRPSSIDWVRLIRFYLKTETESSLRNVVFWKINRTEFLGKDRVSRNIIFALVIPGWSVNSEFQRTWKERSWLNWGTIPAYAWRAHRDENPVRIVCVPADIWTGYLQNSRQNLYRFNQHARSKSFPSLISVDGK